MRTILSLMIAMLVACGGDGAPTGPGKENYQPPTQMMGSGMPSGATQYRCTAAADCSYWFCRCDDGAVVNSALCENGYCMDAASSCPAACQYFQHGGWTGDAGGGPGMTSSTCGGLGSKTPACDSCMHESCCGEATECGQAASCLSYWDCVLPCGDDASCRDSCDAMNPGGKGPYEGLHGCLVDHCLSACT